MRARPGPFHRRFLDDDLADFHRIMSVNVLGVMAGTQVAARHMAANGGGSIINTSSIGGIQAGGGVMTYRASKAAVIHFTKCAAIELAPLGDPGELPRSGQYPDAVARRIGDRLGRRGDQEVREAAIRQQMRDDRPLKREGTPADVAEAALYFASDRSAVRYRHCLPVDGGTVAGKWPSAAPPNGHGDRA